MNAIKKITVKAPGKLMVMGEHAVVYGYPCIVTAIHKHITAEVEIIEAHIDQYETPDVTDQRFIRSALKLFKDTYQIDTCLKLTTKSELGTYGLGSSAATVVATIKALAVLFGKNLSDKEVFDLSYRVVLTIQGKASGFDIAASMYGGTIYFNGKTKEVIPLTRDTLPLLAAFSGVKADTVSLIEMIKQKRENYKKGVDAIFENIEKLVIEAKRAMEEKDWKRVGMLMNYNQNYLEDLGVSTDRLNTLISAAIKGGAWGAKLSGAGGGDCMIALVPMEKKNDVVEAIKEVGGEILDIASSVNGVSRVTMF